jgi:hypothetical protein
MNARKWLLVAGLITELVGVVTALAALVPGALDPAIELLYLQPAQVSFDRYGRLLGGMLGGLMAGWGAIMVVLARSLHELTPAAVARALSIGAGTWFCLDGLASIVNEAYLNLAANSVFLAVLVLPCLAILRSAAPARRRGSVGSELARLTE